MRKNIERIDISKIKDPSIVKKMDYQSLLVLCHDIRKEIITETSLYGGHLASNLGVVELTVALYRCFDFPKDKLIFDVGHQCYTHKILTGRSLKNLNAKGAISGFERRDESVYDCYEAGHSGTSLSAAEGFAIARDLKKENYNIVAVVGDSSIVNGLSFEALNNLGCRNNKVIIVLNDNDMSISRPIGAFGNFFRNISSDRFYNRFKSAYRRFLYRTRFGHALYSFSYYLKMSIKQALVPTTMFDNMGFTYIGPIDGHNIHALESAFHRAKNTTKSAVVHVYTKKGKGYLPAQKDSTGYWHSVTPFDIASGRPLFFHPGFVSWSHYFGNLTKEMMSQNPETVLICPAMVKGSHLEDCFASFPERCFDVGIAEEHALTMAGALSLNGFHPIVSVYSTFLQRAYDEISHDCSRMSTDMTLLIDRAGLAGKNGETHMGIYDEAYLKSIPSITLAMPSSFRVARALFAQSLEKGHGVYAIRYPHALAQMPLNIEPLAVPFLRWRFLSSVIPNKPAVIAVGPHGNDLLMRLRLSSFSGALIDPIFLNPVLDENVNSILPCSKVFIYDAYATEGGFAETLAASLMAKGYQGKIKILALPNVFVQHASIEDQEKDLGVSPEQAFTAASDFCATSSR